VDIGGRLAALPYALKALQIVSLGGAGVLLWNAVAALASGVSGVIVPPLEGAPARRPPVEFAVYQPIGDRNVFHALEKEKPKVVEPVVAPSRLQVRLLGTVVAEPVSRSMGVLRDPTTNQIVQVGIGDAVAAGQAKVVRIEHRRIVLDHGGRLEAIEFEESTAAPRRPGAPGRATPALRGEVDRLRRLNAQRRAAATGGGFGRTTASNVMARAMAAAAAETEGETAPVQSGAGLEVPELPAESRAAASGIEEGDRILAVNGVPIHGTGSLQQLMQTLADGQPKAVDIEREGNATRIQMPGEALADLVRELEAVAD
jgi:type II secretory pathway component PulC